MATIVFAAAGSALFGTTTFWGAVGAASLTSVGAYIDQAYLYPALFPPPDVKGPRLDDLSLQTASDGADSTLCIGPTCRSAGHVFWLTNLFEVKNNINGGGKGGSSGNYIEYTYFCHAAVAVAANVTSRIKQIYADGVKLYDLTPDITYTDSSSQWTGTKSSYSYVSGGTTFYVDYLTINSPSGAADLSEFKTGRTLVISGFTVGWTTNNGEWYVESSGRKQTGATWVKVRRGDPASSSTPFSDFIPANGLTPTLFQTAPLFSKKIVQDLRFYNGTEASNGSPDPLMQSFETSIVPNYEGYSYVVFEKFWVTDFGRLPLLSFVVEERETCSVGDAISTLLEFGGLTSSRYDVSLCTEDFLGYSFKGSQSLSSILQPILIAYNIMVSESNGKLVFTPRSLLPELAIERPGVSSGTSSPHPHRLREDYDLDTPTEIVIRYIQNYEPYEDGSRSSRRGSLSGLENTRDLDLGLVLSDEQAQDLADRLLWSSSSQKTVRLDLTPEYSSRAVEGTIAVYEDEGEEFRVILTKVDRSALDLVSCEGLIEQDHLFV